jgi:colicin import membrane protein
MGLGSTATKALSPGGRRAAVTIGVTTALMAASGSAYACSTTASADGMAMVGSRLVTQDELAAFKSQLAKDAAAVRAAKAAELAAIEARDKVAAVAAAKAAAAAKAKLRADVEAAIAKARAAAKARAEARAKTDAFDASKRFGDPSRHQCDGHWGDNDALHESWGGSSWHGTWGR